MSRDELARVQNLSDWYLKDQLDFDKRLIRFRYEAIKPHFVGNRCLELGPANGEMTPFLANDFEHLTIVEGAQELLEKIPNFSNMVKVHSLFEDFKPESKFDTIILEHVLEHVENPVELLKRVKEWLAPNGRFCLGVPNGHSFHRLVAVKMGLLDHPCQLNDRDHAVGHRRVYTPESFKADIVQSGLQIIEQGGVFFKPLSNGQIHEYWNEEMMQGFFELGKDFPDNAGEIYAICANHS